MVRCKIVIFSIFNIFIFSWVCTFNEKNNQRKTKQKKNCQKRCKAKKKLSFVMLIANQGWSFCTKSHSFCTYSYYTSKLYIINSLYKNYSVYFIPQKILRKRRLIGTVDHQHSISLQKKYYKKRRETKKKNSGFLFDGQFSYRSDI